ncbi:MAG: response regulator [Saprospiraceae bacterium]|nr:response regulator [Saprospiraceae bacterium]MDZ4704582.1 response regulator [Saprospiraceae bacterium]
MSNLNKIKIFLVDDDAVYLKFLELEFIRQGEFTVETYATGELCIARLPQNPDIIILDYFLNSVDKRAMNGIDTLDKIKAFNPAIPVIILSCQENIDIATNCIKHMAYDYVLKNEMAFMCLQNIIATICMLKKIENKFYLA